MPATSLGRDDVVRYLTEQSQRGYQVFQGSQGPHFLVLALTERQRINFVLTAGGCQVQAEEFGQPWSIADVSTSAQLRSAVDGIAQRVLGAGWARSPTSGRLAQDSPASNLATISSLVGTETVQAIFDPYLENRSLAELIKVLSFGRGTVTNGVRVLSTAKTTGQIPTLTKAGFDMWLAQLKITGEIRIMSGSEHRRFMLLSGGQSLLLGLSLNSLHKNEAIRLEPDLEDRAFFDKVWTTATPLA